MTHSNFRQVDWLPSGRSSDDSTTERTLLPATYHQRVSLSGEYSGGVCLYDPMVDRVHLNYVASVIFDEQRTRNSRSSHTHKEWFSIKKS